MAEARTLGLVVVHAKCVRDADEPEWDAWEDDVHVPALVRARRRVGGDAVRAHRPSATGDARHRVHPRDHPRARRRRRGGAGRAHPRRRRRAARRPAGCIPRARHHRGRRLRRARSATGPSPRRPPRAPATSSPTCSAPIPPASTSGTAGTTTSTCPTCSRAARSRRCHGGGGPRRAAVGSNHLTLYDVATPTVEEAVARSATTLADVVAAGRKHECHTGALTVTLRPTGRHGGDGIRRIG